MKKFPILLLLALLVGIVVACSSDNKEDESDYWTKYKEWREDNDAWLAQQAARTNADGTPYFTKVTPSWDPSAYVLLHYFNDTMLTRENLKPLSTSWIDVKYMGRLYDDVAFDSSYAYTNYGDSVARFHLPDLVTGWAIGLAEMHVGDSVEMLIPYQQGYYATSRGVIKPYSALRFNIKLVDIPYYEIYNPDSIATNK